MRLDVVCTEGEVNVKRNMDRKQQLADQMFESIVAFMNESEVRNDSRPTMKVEVPQWMCSTAK